MYVRVSLRQVNDVKLSKVNGATSAVDSQNYRLIEFVDTG